MRGNENPITDNAGLTTEKATAILLIASLVLLILIRRGFRGVGVPGVGGLNLR